MIIMRVLFIVLGFLSNKEGEWKKYDLMRVQRKG